MLFGKRLVPRLRRGMLILMAVQKWPLLLQLVVAGEENVGKSTLIAKYMNSDPPY